MRKPEDSGGFSALLVSSARLVAIHQQLPEDQRGFDAGRWKRGRRRGRVPTIVSPSTKPSATRRHSTECAMCSAREVIESVGARGLRRLKAILPDQGNIGWSPYCMNRHERVERTRGLRCRLIRYPFASASSRN